MTRKTYHHGNLRSELLKVAKDEIEVSGHEELSLRVLAKRLGVSPGAPYRHFKTKDVLLRELVWNGLEELNASYSDARKKFKEPKKVLHHACKAYLEFASKSPVLYRLIFMTDLHEVETSREQRRGEEGVNAFRIFEEIVSQVHSADTHDIAVAIWCTLHGLATLKINGTIHELADAEKIEDRILRSIMAN